MDETKKQKKSNTLMQENVILPADYEGVFGSIGSVNYYIEGNTLIIEDGVVLLGGVFHSLGQKKLLIKGATRYLCIQQDKFELGELEVVVSKTWEADSDTHYIVTVLVIKQDTTKKEITRVDKIGGNLPEVYNLLNKAIRNKAKTVDDKVETVGAQVESLTTQVTDVRDMLTKQVQMMEEQMYGTIAQLNNKITSNETNLQTVSKKVQSVDTQVKNVDNQVKNMQTKIQNTALYKHMIRVKFRVTPVDRPRSVINLAFVTYSKKSERLINNPNSVNTPTLIAQLEKALYDNVKLPRTIVSVSGDFTVSFEYLRGASIWGVAFEANGQVMTIYYEFERASNQKLFVGTLASQGPVFVEETFSYSEEIIRVL